MYPFFSFKRRFKNDWHLKRHQKLIHTKQETVNCPQCSIPLANPVALSAHLRHVHPTFDDFFCKLCPKKFYSARKINMHMKRMHIDSNAVCEICNLKFDGANGLSHHMAKLHQITLKNYKKMKMTEEAIELKPNI